MRYVGCAVLAFLVVSAAACSAVAAERPMAALVPADAGSYVELNTDRLLGRSPDTALLGAAFGQMKSPAMIKQAWAELTAGEAEAAEAAKVFGMVSGGLGALGPRIAWAVWSPDLQSLMGVMMAGAGGGAPDMTKMMPKVLLVADLRDGSRLEAAIAQLASEADLEVETTESGGIKTMAFAGGVVELVHGGDWVAVGFPAELARRAAERATGAVTDSLIGNADYQTAMRRLPPDAVYTVFASPAAMRQFQALASTLAPNAGIATTISEPFGAAAGLRVDEVGGRQMATVYYTADLESYVSMLDAALAFEVSVLKPILQQQKEQARRQALSDECANRIYGLMEAMDSYLEDHGNVYPSADEWVEALRPYVEDESMFRCTEDTSDGFCSYGMNSALSGTSPDDVADPETTVLFYETANPGDNPSGEVYDVVNPPRHVDGNNFGFVDGSVAAYGQEEMGELVWSPEGSAEEQEEESDLGESGEGA
ncbi:MAG: hypothetical protein ACE149_01000 [Armatimonadota bacterium]